MASAGPAQAAARYALDIPAGPLADALIALGERTGATIGIEDAGAQRAHSPGARGRLSLPAALARLLAGTGYRFLPVDATTFRIVPAPRTMHRADRLRPPPPASPSPTPPQQPPPLTLPDIIVTASKTRTPLDRYAGTADILDLAHAGTTQEAARGTEAITASLPTIASTNLGPGRNKLFVRGVADSSFNGPTQATVGQYLGDVRLTYNAPDPSLNLYDMARIELLEGPQGTLYGTGALGGILRIVPNPVDLDGFAGSIAGGGTATRHGAEGGDLAAMANLPLAPGLLGLRLVAYGALDPGYIDDIGRNAKNVNRAVKYGGRATLRLAPGDGWTIDMGGVVQNIDIRDGQYAERGLPPLTHFSRLAQPFDNDYALGHIVVHKEWASGLDLVSASAIVRHDVETRFDATGAPDTSGLTLFLQHDAITLLSHETRLTGRIGKRGAWIGGVSILHDMQRLSRRLGDPGNPAPITGVRNAVTEIAAFGQAELPVGPRLTATIGGRLTYADASGEPLDVQKPDAFEARRTEAHFSPTLAIAWRASGRLSVFAHLQRGFRAGGLAISQDGALQSVQRFKPDEISVVEAGFRFGQRGRDPLWASATVSHAQWRNIQADLVDRRGLPFTANIGDGRIWGLEARIGWAPLAALTLDGGLFLNDSELRHPAPDFTSSDEAELPNIARAGGRIRATWRTRLSDRIGLTIDTAVRYVGKSELGIAPPLAIPQGDFTEASAGARLDFGRLGVSLDISNLSDSRGNRFSFGNPFSVDQGRQTTPLRPRTVRLGFDAHF